MILGADSISGTEILESDSCTDISRLYEIYRILLVGMHLVKPCDTLFLA